jgi:hypothetical protein
MNADAEKFWRDFEVETGEKVQTRGLGQLLGEDGREMSTWGLLILTDKAFRFRSMQSEPWFASLLNFGSRKTEAKKPLDLVFALTDIASVEVESRSLLGRIFGSPYRRFAIVLKGASSPTTAFLADPGDGFIAALKQAGSGQP